MWQWIGLRKNLRENVTILPSKSRGSSNCSLKRNMGSTEPDNKPQWVVFLCWDRYMIKNQNPWVMICTYWCSNNNNNYIFVPTPMTETQSWHLSPWSELATCKRWPNHNHRNLPPWNSSDWPVCDMLNWLCKTIHPCPSESIIWTTWPLVLTLLCTHEIWAKLRMYARSIAKFWEVQNFEFWYNFDQVMMKCTPWYGT
jgi:hypothetical protein